MVGLCGSFALLEVEQNEGEGNEPTVVRAIVVALFHPFNVGFT
jgi:hypothetical protein